MGEEGNKHPHCFGIIPCYWAHMCKESFDWVHIKGNVASFQLLFGAVPLDVNGSQNMKRNKISANILEKIILNLLVFKTLISCHSCYSLLQSLEM